MMMSMPAFMPGRRRGSGLGEVGVGAGNSKLCSARMEISETLPGRSSYGERIDTDADILTERDAAAMHFLDGGVHLEGLEIGISAIMFTGQTLSPTLKGLAFIQPCE